LSQRHDRKTIETSQSLKALWAVSCLMAAARTMRFFIASGENIYCYNRGSRMNISLIAVGKIKEKYLEQGIAEYKKRLQSYCRLTIIEVADRAAPDNLSPLQLEGIKTREGEDILKRIKDPAYVIALDESGIKISSVGMSRHIDRLAVSGIGNIIFVIGGSNGLSEQVLNRADMRLSFSEMTFPHQLMRLILLEQIYRWFKISRNEPYHK
jgi:23S rRNA (pseudouridine1915-N3)-methyltransferase